MEVPDWVTSIGIGGAVVLLRELFPYVLAFARGQRETMAVQQQHERERIAVEQQNDRERLETLAKIQRDQEILDHELEQSEYSKTIADLREDQKKLVARLDKKDQAHMACEQKCSRIETQLEVAQSHIKLLETTIAKLEARIAHLESRDQLQQREFLN